MSAQWRREAVAPPPDAERCDGEWLRPRSARAEPAHDCVGAALRVLRLLRPNRSHRCEVEARLKLNLRRYKETRHWKI